MLSNNRKIGSGLESLERRNMMAVTVSAVNGDLLINGDAGNDQIQVSKLTSGAIRVEGLNGTRVNGANFADRFFNDDLYINLGNGNYNSLNILNVNGGITADFVDIKAGSGADSIHIRQLIVSDDIFIDTGAGNDFVEMNTVSAFNRINGLGDNGINVYTRSGNDRVSMYNCYSTVDVSVLLDEPLAGALGYTDSLYMGNVTALDDFWLYGFGGKDTMSLDRLVAGDILFAHLGAGNDYLKLTNSYARTNDTHGDAGSDTLQWYNDSYTRWNYTGWERYVNQR
jgi:hypothetical protein